MNLHETKAVLFWMDALTEMAKREPDGVLYVRELVLEDDGARFVAKINADAEGEWQVVTDL